MERNLTPEPLNDDTAFVLVCLRCTALLGQFSQFPDTPELRTLAFSLTGAHARTTGCPQDSEVVESDEPYNTTRTIRINLYMTRRN